MLKKLPPDHSFPTFLWAFANNWASLVSGAASVPFTILALFFTNVAAKWSFASLAILCFAWASYSVWKDQRKCYLDERDRNSKPEFKGDLEKLYAAQCRPLQPSDKTVEYRFVACVSLVNIRPAAASIRGFELIITGEEGGHIATLINRPPLDPHLVIIVADGSAMGKELGPAEMPYLMETIRSKKLEQGVHESGWVGFRLDHSILHARKQRYELVLIDGYGDRHKLGDNSTIYRDAFCEADRRL
jgi:hypothetical protein